MLVILQGRNVILADEMGLGKTAQIASLLEIISTGNTRNITVKCACDTLLVLAGVRCMYVPFCSGGWNASPISGPFLIIAPLSTLGHWRRELATWTALNAIVYNGDAVSRDVIFKQEWFYRSDGSIVCNHPSPSRR